MCVLNTPLLRDVLRQGHAQVKVHTSPFSNGGDQLSLRQNLVVTEPWPQRWELCVLAAQLPGLTLHVCCEGWIRFCKIKNMEESHRIHDGILLLPGICSVCACGDFSSLFCFPALHPLHITTLIPKALCHILPMCHWPPPSLLSAVSAVCLVSTWNRGVSCICLL